MLIPPRAKQIGMRAVRMGASELTSHKLCVEEHHRHSVLALHPWVARGALLVHKSQQQGERRRSRRSRKDRRRKQEHMAAGVQFLVR